MTRPVRTFGDRLRTWRTHRRYSQLQLSAEADVSQRHLSFLERGRSRPSREMVLHLAGVLDVPLREKNDLLSAAGYAPVYEQRELEGDGLRDISAVLEPVLAAHEPYPAIVLDRHWNVILTNTSAARFTAALLDPIAVAATGGLNLARLALHPDGLRTVTDNWDEVGPSLIRRLEHQLRNRPNDTELRTLYDQVMAFDGVAELREPDTNPAAGDLVLAIHYRTDDVELRLFSMLATLGEPHDVTMSELVLETFYPADDASRETLLTWHRDLE